MRIEHVFDSVGEVRGEAGVENTGDGDAQDDRVVGESVVAEDEEFLRRVAALAADPELIRRRELDERLGVLAAQVHALSAEFVDTLVEFDEAGGWQDGGFRSLGQWLSVRTKFTPADSARFARVAAASVSMPTLMADARSGQLSTGVLDMAARVVSDRNEEQLARVVRDCTPAQAARVLSRYRDLEPAAAQRRDTTNPAAGPDDTTDTDPDGTTDTDTDPDADAGAGNGADAGAAGSGSSRGEPERPAPCWWNLWYDDQGRGRIDAAVDAATAALLDTAWRAARRAGERDRTNNADNTNTADSGSGSGGEGAAAAADRLDANEIASRLASTMLDHANDNDLLDRGGDRFCVQVNIDVETLAEILGIDIDSSLPVRLGREAFYANTGRHLSRSELARICCDTQMQVLVHADGVPLWMSNTTRNFTRHQRRALRFRSGGHGGCEYPGCAQTRYLDVHHVQHHNHGGHTSLDNAVLLCGYHHRQHHQHRFTITTTGDQVFTFRDRWGRHLGTSNRADAPGGAPPTHATLPGIDQPPDPDERFDADTAQSGGRGEPLTRYGLDVLLATLLDA